MTEAQWRAEKDPRRMLSFLKDRASLRKLRLFACACYRRVKWYDQLVIALVEGYADGEVRRKEAMAAVKDAIPQGHIEVYCSWLFWRDRCHMGTDISAAFCVDSALTSHGVEETAENVRAEERYHAHLLHDIFGNPFRSISIAPGWQTPTVLALVQAAYDNRILPAGTLEPVRLAVLADALEEAGCDNAAILNHLRGTEQHIQGCWALDLLLGKE